MFLKICFRFQFENTNIFFFIFIFKYCLCFLNSTKLGGKCVSMLHKMTLFLSRFILNDSLHIQYYAKSEDNFKMAANFEWTTRGISNLCNNINKNKSTYLVLCYTSLSFKYLLQTLGNWFIKVLNIINVYFQSICYD